MKKNQQESSAVNGLSRRKFLEQAGVLSAFFIIPRHVLGRGFTPPSDKINLGFIGAGKQAMGLQKSFIGKQGVRVAAISDVYPMKMDAFVAQAAKYFAEKSMTGGKDIQSYADYLELLADNGIDAVVIATPDHWHGVQAVKAAAAGKDIYCEKPLSLTVREGRMMADVAAKYKRVFQTGSMQRSWKEFRQAVELVRNGYIGDIKNVKVSVGAPPIAYNLPEEPMPAGLNWDRWLGPNTERSHFNNQLNPPLEAKYWGKWRDFKEFGGGQMTDWGAHMFDIAQWALDMDSKGPVSVTPPDGKDVRFLTYQYENGIIMTHENFGTTNAVLFTGTTGTIEVQRGKLTTTPGELATKVIGSSEKRVYYSDDHYTDFLNAIAKRSKPICDVETGHRTATVCNIGNIAYELKRPLKWDYRKEKFLNDDDANALLTRKMRKEYGF